MSCRPFENAPRAKFGLIGPNNNASCAHNYFLLLWLAAWLVAWLVASEFCHSRSMHTVEPCGKYITPYKGNGQKVANMYKQLHVLAH